MEIPSQDDIVAKRILIVSLLLFVMFIFDAQGQETTTEDLTTVPSQEDIPSLKAPSIFKFPKNRTPQRSITRIIGGEVATANAYPFQAALYITVSRSTFFCGGTLITTEWVLTAAHCVEGASSILVLLGVHDLSVAENTRLRLNSSTFVIHKGWNITSLQNDIALIKLPRNVTLNRYITTVDLPQGNKTYDGILGRCLGWGRTILGSLSNVLRYVDAEIINNTHCSSYTEYGDYIVDHHLCTSGEGTVGSCNGDSGGPLIVEGLQVGIVSFGANSCSAGLPSVYTRLTSFYSWIQENAQGKGYKMGPGMGVYIGLICVMFLNTYIEL